jgi:hypothetical protein
MDRPDFPGDPEHAGVSFGSLVLNRDPLKRIAFLEAFFKPVIP